MPQFPIRVLAVDDEADICTLTKRFLEMSEAMEVDTVCSVREAMAELANKRYDVIVSDYQMPGEDGIQFLKSLRAADNEIPFILFTGKGREEVVIEALNNGADSYMQKGGKSVPQYAELEHRIHVVVQRHRGEEALRLSEEKYKKVFFTNHDSICITRLSDGLFVSTNNAFAEMTGYEEGEIIGKTSLEINIWKDPEDRKKIVEGLLSKGEVRDYEACFLTKNGEIYGSMSASIIELNGVPHILNITRDITEHKVTEEALRASQQIIEGIINAIPVRVFWKDKNLFYMGCNAIFARDAGFTDQKDVIGKDDYQMVWRDQAELYRGDDHNVIESGSPKLLIEEPQRTPSGDIITLLTSKIPLRSSEGEIMGVLGTYIDITESKRAEQEREVVHAIGEAIITNPNLDEILQVIHQNIKKVMYAENCYIALWDANTGMISFPFFVDQFDPKLASRANQRGLTEYVLMTARPLLLTPEKLGEMVRQNEVEIIGTPPESWLGVPLFIQSNPVGVLVVQSYEPGNKYTDAEKDLLVAIGNQAALVIERKRTEESLRESEERIRLLLNSAAEAIYGIDINGNCTFCNNACLLQLGYHRPYELLGKNMHWQIHSKHSDGTPFPIEECRIFQAFKKGEGTHVDDEVLWRSDGTSFPVEYWSYPQFHNGAIVGAVMSFLDITERKRAEEALRESLQRYELVMDGSSAGLWDWDVPNKRIHFSSRWKAMRGYTDDEIGDSEIEWSLRVHPDDELRVMAALQAHFAGQTDVYEEEYRIRCKDGSIKWIFDRGKAVRDDAGRVIRAAGSEIDITERKRAEDALRQANIKLGILNTITRHDINNQMMALNGFLELAKLREKDPNLATYLEKMSRVAANVSEQIAFTKTYQELGVHAPAWASVGRRINVAFSMLNPPGVVLEDKTDGVEVLTDPMADKVPYNLVDNSMRHGGHITRIKMSAEQVGDAMLIVYEDDGVGISAEDKKRLFQKGFGKNTGYGLFLIREILAITGITITEKGQAGKGVRFEMLVPSGAWRRT